MSYRICYSGPNSPAHVEHSGGLTFCGRDAAWYDGPIHKATKYDALTFIRHVRHCRRCEASLARYVANEQRRAVLNASSVGVMEVR